MRLNRLPERHHEFIRADCFKWLDEARQHGRRYQVIFLDPPTFSNSKRMDHTLDIRRDHVDLIQQAMALLDDQGVMIFSCNAKGFKLDTKSLEMFSLRDITRMTTPEDYRRKPAHSCWCLAKNPEALKACSSP
jgi:23S rRNA G2069 N7-methylase RlmK/C1962 C5-methylase RlmI